MASLSFSWRRKSVLMSHLWFKTSWRSLVSENWGVLHGPPHLCARDQWTAGTYNLLTVLIWKREIGAFLYPDNFCFASRLFHFGGCPKDIYQREQARACFQRAQEQLEMDHFVLTKLPITSQAQTSLHPSALKVLLAHCWYQCLLICITFSF